MHHGPSTLDSERSGPVVHAREGAASPAEPAACSHLDLLQPLVDARRQAAKALGDDARAGAAVAELTSRREPAERRRRVLLCALSREEALSEQVHGARHAQLGRPPEPADRLVRVRLDAVAQVVHRPDLVHRLRVAGGGRLVVVVQRFCRVLLHHVAVAQQESPGACAWRRARVGQAAHQVGALGLFLRRRRLIGRVAEERTAKKRDRQLEGDLVALMVPLCDPPAALGSKKPLLPSTRVERAPQRGPAPGFGALTARRPARVWDLVLGRPSRD
mmetsp:Transcript_52011/g.166963  ORF Transcript_52011/g.166963 Transcript_52011/m.166963 type:complete len:274 (+) Transcript_52011:210-1031(+)